MLCEQLSQIEGVKMVMANTDGCELIVPRNKKREAYNVCVGIEKLTQLQLEYAVYDKLFTRDINNYLCVDVNGKVKTKGAFDIDLELHKNRSERIVPLAVKRYFVNNVPVEDTIKSHLKVGNYGKIENQGIYDFCVGKKIQSNQNYTIEDDESNIIKHIDDKVIRFFVSTNGNNLKKNYSDGRKEITVGGNKITMFMDFYKLDDYKVNYDYYIAQANKIIHNVDGTTERLEAERRVEIARLKQEKEENDYTINCLEKIPTSLQFQRFGKEHIVAKLGMPKEIKPSKVKKVLTDWEV
jgi:hypothetical protein